MVILDFIRYHKNLTGTKIGCREGDCGACTILVGTLNHDEVSYRSATSCLMPLGNAQGKHIVTIEGINPEKEDGLNLIQQSMADEGATQCGFCTPGFVMSLAGYCLSKQDAPVLSAIDGNICRCTGYKSIERAAEKIKKVLDKKDQDYPIEFLIHQNILPGYFGDIKNKLGAMVPPTNGQPEFAQQGRFMGGGTDLYVQDHDSLKSASLRFLFDREQLSGIVQEGRTCTIGAATTVTDLLQSELLKSHFPNLPRYIKLVSSTPIRNMATVGGNFINASPIGDLTIFFLALDAKLHLTDGVQNRMIDLNKFYLGYKKLDMQKGEWLDAISFDLPEDHELFHFEKVSKRTHLDIASVNTAIRLRMKNDVILRAGLSAGGVSPIPLFLKGASSFLEGKTVSENLVHELLEMVQKEISPISDARGSAGYKRLLLDQLVKAHFIQLFPQLEIDKILARV